MKLLYLKIFSVQFILFIGTIVYSMGGLEHIAFWYDCFGLDKNDTESRLQLEPLFKQIQKEIDWVFRREDPFDDGSEEYLRFWNNLKKKYPDFNTFEYKHRLFFHWGFNAKIKNYEPLKKCLKNLKYSDEQIKDIYDLIEKENETRKNRVIKSIRKTTGFDLLSAKALATILYDIHLLSDWETGNGIGLLSIDQLRTDILYNGYNYLCNQKILYQEIRKAIIPASSAKEMNEINMKYLPIVLKENFDEILKQNGIVIQINQPEAVIAK